MLSDNTSPSPSLTSMPTFEIWNFGILALEFGTWDRELLLNFERDWHLSMSLLCNSFDGRFGIIYVLIWWVLAELCT